MMFLTDPGSKSKIVGKIEPTDKEERIKVIFTETLSLNSQKYCMGWGSGIWKNLSQIPDQGSKNH
jgi:hypothetical protein